MREPRRCARIERARLRGRRSFLGRRRGAWRVLRRLGLRRRLRAGCAVSILGRLGEGAGLF